MNDEPTTSRARLCPLLSCCAAAVLSWGCASGRPPVVGMEIVNAGEEPVEVARVTKGRDDTLRVDRPVEVAPGDRVVVRAREDEYVFVSSAAHRDVFSPPKPDDTEWCYRPFPVTTAVHLPVVVPVQRGVFEIFAAEGRVVEFRPAGSDGLRLAPTELRAAAGSP